MLSLLIALSIPSIAAERPAPLPEPLPERKMQLADPEIDTLSNGIEVRVANNAEVPLFEVRLVFAVGGYADPAGKEGTAELTFDMLDEGTDTRSSTELAAELKRLAGTVHSFADADAGYIVASGLKRNMAETLDVWADVALNPTFPDKEWKLVKQRTESDLKLSMEDPSAIARNVYRHLVWGDGYIGRPTTAESVKAIGIDDLKSFYGDHIAPENAIVFVGGDVTMAEIKPLLEERLGGWSNDGFKEAPVVAEPIPVDRETIYFVDKPGAAQSVVRGITVIGTLEERDLFDLLVGNQMFGGSFTGRINMNLREDKGYTYGAGCYVVHRHGPGVYLCNSSVRTDATAPSLIEFRTEIAGLLDDAPLSEDEIATAADNMAFGWPGRFETTGPVLDLEFEIWRYGKSEDWAADYVPNIRKVTTDSANAAMKKWVVPDQTFWLIVGDKSVVFEDLEAIGLPIVELDRNGTPLSAD